MKKQMTYNVFIDDKLRPIDIFNKTSNPQYQGSFFVAKSYDEFIQYVEEHFNQDGSYPGFVSFDYLLTPVTMQVTEDYSVYQNDDSYKPTGLECAKWLAEFLRKNNLPNPKIIVHDLNPRGKREIPKAFTTTTSKVADPFTQNETIETPTIPINNPIVKTENVVTTEKAIPIINPVEKTETKEKTKKANSSHGDKTKDKEYIIGILCNSLTDKNLTKKEIDEILLPKLSDNYDLKQKKTKIENIMWELKLKGVIVNEGTIRVPSWKLIKN